MIRYPHPKTRTYQESCSEQMEQTLSYMGEATVMKIQGMLHVGSMTRADSVDRVMKSEIIECSVQNPCFIYAI